MRLSFYANALVIASLVLLPADAKPGKGKGHGGGPPGQAKHQKGHAPGHAKGNHHDPGPPGHAKGGKARIKPSHPAGHGGHAGRDKKGGKPHFKHFGDHDRERILGYFHDFRDRGSGLPPGIAKRLRDGKGLPPGWQKKLSRGSVIPGDWWGRLVPIPYSRFPDLPRVADTGLYLYGNRLFRVYEPRREIIEVIVVPTIHIDF